jgi:uncharacterized protein YecT (DUF1311 family)
LVLRPGGFNEMIPRLHSCSKLARLYRAVLKSAFAALWLGSIASPTLAQDGPLVLGPTTSPLVARGSEKPSFDCAKAKTAAARLICADGDLARLDGELGVTFRKRKTQLPASDQSKFVSDQLAWIRARNTRCDLDGKNKEPIEELSGSKLCMANALRERIAVLVHTDFTAAPAEALPQKPTVFVI